MPWFWDIANVLIISIFTVVSLPMPKRHWALAFAEAAGLMQMTYCGASLYTVAARSVAACQQCSGTMPRQHDPSIGTIKQ